MTAANPLPEDDLRNLYGYSDRRGFNLDLMADAWSTKCGQGWSRSFEIKVDMRKHLPTTDEKAPHMTQDEVEYFTKGARYGFKYIAERHGMTPLEMWETVEVWMRRLGLHSDDVEDIQQFCFGWIDLTPEAMCRWSIRYPQRCPLLDVLCSLDHTCSELNQVQDWLLDKKGSYGRTCNDVLPVLPTPDGKRPCACQSKIVQTKTKA